MEIKSDEELQDHPDNLPEINPESPAYYSKRAIYLFSFFFSVLFGSVLMSINLRNTKTSEGVWEAIAYGIIFCGAQMWILSLLPDSTVLTFLSSGFGAMLMNYLFWGKYIGDDTTYTAKSIWKPLAVAAIIFIPITLLLFYSLQNS